MNPEQLQQFQELQKVVKEIQTQRLPYNLDVESKKVIKKTVDEFSSDDVFDSIRQKVFNWITLFDSIDGYGKTGIGTATVTLTGSGGVLLNTGATAPGDYEEVDKTIANKSLLSFSQKSYLRAIFQYSANGDATKGTGYIVVGDFAGGVTPGWYGFKIASSNLYGVCHDGTTEATVLLVAGIANPSTYLVEARFEPSNKVVFLVGPAIYQLGNDLIEMGTLTVNLPPASSEHSTVMFLRMATSEAAAKFLNVNYYEYAQNRNSIR